MRQIRECFVEHSLLPLKSPYRIPELIDVANYAVPTRNEFRGRRHIDNANALGPNRDDNPTNCGESRNALKEKSDP